MTSDPWKVDDSSEDKEHEATVLLPDGSERTVRGSDQFAQTIRDIARDAGLSKFTVIVDGEEIDSSEAPVDFAKVDEVELTKYDEGA